MTLGIAALLCLLYTVLHPTGTQMNVFHTSHIILTWLNTIPFSGAEKGKPKLYLAMQYIHKILVSFISFHRKNIERIILLRNAIEIWGNINAVVLAAKPISKHGMWGFQFASQKACTQEWNYSNEWMCSTYKPYVHQCENVKAVINAACLQGHVSSV